MPTSYHGYITDCIEKVRELKPKSVLDVGVGFGKWGFLFREYLDVMEGRVYPEDWQTQIDGIEIHAPYLGPWQRSIYSNIMVGNAVEIFRSKPLQTYDLIFCSDVLEHIPRAAAANLLVHFRLKAKAVLINVPIGEEWLDQGELYGNAHEAHVSAWDKPDFPESSYSKLYRCNNGRMIASVGWGI